VSPPKIGSYHPHPPSPSPDDDNGDNDEKLTGISRTEPLPKNKKVLKKR